MTYGVYVGDTYSKGRLVLRTPRLRDAVDFAQTKEKWRWVWVQAVQC